MAELRKMEPKELKALIDLNIFEFFTVCSSDLDKKKDYPSRRFSKKECKDLVDKCKTIIAMLDNAGEEDSLDIYALYTALQEDIFNIKPVGFEHKMILVPEEK